MLITGEVEKVQIKTPKINILKKFPRIFYIVLVFLKYVEISKACISVTSSKLKVRGQGRS